MPVIARLFGVVIKMYFRDSEHNPPHIHAIYGEYSGIFDIEIPYREVRQSKFILAFVLIY